MKFNSLLRKFFQGYLVLEKAESEINGLIEVREDFFGRKSLLAGGISQSGYLIEKEWQKPLKTICHKPYTISNILILGLGAGSVAKVIHNFFPKAKILGLEIDPIMIKMAKKYFDLSTVKNLEIKIGDGVELLGRWNKKFDLILVDIYLGKKVPEKAKTDEFIKKVKKTLSPSGIAVFNRLYYGKKKKRANRFEIRLKKIFSEVEPLHVTTNIFFFCQ